MALWAWISDHATVLSAVVSAISTVIVAAFTVGLFRATNRQSHLLGRSIDLARDEFLATHRPKVIIREVYWVPNQPGNIAITLVNTGSRDARISEFRTEFDRTNDVPLVHSGPNVTHAWEIKRGAFEILSLPIEPEQGFAFGAFREGLVESIRFEGLVIYADDTGTLYHSVFKRVCHKGTNIFIRTGNPDDEYSD